MIELTEKENQRNFFKSYKSFINSIKEKDLDDILSNHSDGLVEGNIFEFKKNIKDINPVLFQVIKILSRCRIKGISIPANILLVSFDDKKIYKFNSQDFLNDIQKLYFGPSSKNNNDFNTHIKPELIFYGEDKGNNRLIDVLREKKYTKIDIDENCILGWAERYYKENKNAKKGDFLGVKDHTRFPNDGEIRNPNVFREYINPYIGKDNDKFKYLMDRLNDKISKKVLGAYYTPKPYCELAVKMVRDAIKLVPHGNDYVILDRCAGTGNLEELLSEEELRRCILSTYEYYEYKVLILSLGDKVKYIIPPNDDEIDYNSGYIENANALTEKYINNTYLKDFVNNPKMTIIMLENPPFKDVTTSRGVQQEKEQSKTFIKTQMKEKNAGKASNDLSNQFIWSAFEYFLKKPEDSYIVFSPVKYFKSDKLVNKKFKQGFLVNRKHFNTSPQAISLIHWQNQHEEKEEYNFKAYDIELLKSTTLNEQEKINEGKLIFIKDVVVKKAHKMFSEYYDREKFKDDNPVNIYCEKNGYEIASNTNKKVVKNKSFDNKNIIGYLVCKSFLLTSAQNYNLTRQMQYDEHGFYLRSDNFIEKLPLFCAKIFDSKNWYEKSIYFSTSDGGDKYLKDGEFLRRCFIYTCLSEKNRCISFISQNGQYYKNELCFDRDTLSSIKLKEMSLDKADKEILQLWELVLEKVQKKVHYKKSFTYGLYQIEKEINMYDEIVKSNKKKEKIYHDVELNTKINSLKKKLKEYYDEKIKDKLFQYQLLK